MNNVVNLGMTEDGERLGIDIKGLVDSRMLIQGNSGGGKSWLLRLLCERAAAHVPIIVLDPEGEFASLREKLDMVLVGNDGEIAADLRSAGLLARKLVELEVSAVIDIYELSPQHQREYVKLFLDALIHLPRTLWHPTLICLDEAHKFCPEKGTGEAVSTKAVIDLMSLGRKRGYAGILATQRFSKLHNDAIAETNNVCIGRTWLDADQKRAGEYLGMAAADRRKLRDLGKGEFYAFGPALSVGGVNRFKSDVVETTHPKPGERHKLKPPRASEAIRHIVSQLEGLPEQAEEEARTVAALQAQLKEARQTITRLERERPEPLPPERIEVQLIPDEQMAAMRELGDIVGEHMKTLGLALGTFEQALHLAGQTPRPKPVPAAAPATAAHHKARSVSAPAAHTPLKAVRAQPAAADDGFVINKTQQRILDALAWYESIGIQEPSNLQVGAIALIDVTGGHFSNIVGPLSSRGLVRRGDGRMRLTDEGRALASVPEQIATLDDYHEVLRARVRRARSASPRTVDILNVVIARRGEEVSAEEIGREIGIDHTGGHFSNTIGPLGTLGLVERRAGMVRPTEILFPPGLA